MTKHYFSSFGFALGSSVLLSSGAWAADQVACTLKGYKPQAGLTAAVDGSALVVTWNGDSDQEVRLRMTVNGGTPTIEELALRRGAGAWSALATNLTPDYTVTTGVRRISNQQLQPLRDLGVPFTNEEISKYRWDPFWDAPLDMLPPARNAQGQVGGNPPPPEGIPGAGQLGTPRSPSEVQRSEAQYAVKNCSVTTEGARLTVTYPGVKLGVFDGNLQYTVFKGTNLIKQEVVATTKAEWVAYKYDAGLKGFAIRPDSHVAWRGISNIWQRYAFGGPVNKDRVPLIASNRLVVAEQGSAGAITAFPPPHKFFWARQQASIVGYNYYRKDSDTSYAIGIRQNDREHVSQVRFRENWALYSARPGTQQLMTAFYYPSLDSAEQTAEKTLAFTHGDKYRPLPGYQVLQHHLHTDLGQRLIDSNNIDEFMPDFEAFKAMGINIVSQIDSVFTQGFSPIGDPDVPVKLPEKPRSQADRFAITAASVEGAMRSSDKNFSVLANQEVYGSPLGGHTDLLFSKPVFWDQKLTPDQPFEEMHPTYGKVYHIGTTAEFMKMIETEKVLITMPHPRSKGSSGFPDAVKDREYFKSPYYHGFGFRWGMGLDGSERKTCEYRCLPLLDDLANWTVDQAGPLKYAVSISEVRWQQPGDDIYSGSPVTYVKLDKVPTVMDATPLTEALMRGDMFVTTGEVLVPHFEVRGTGNNRTIVADVQWTFPLEEVEIVWGDGKKTGRQVVSAKDLPPFGTHRFEIPFDARGKKWVRFAAWDSAYQGAVLQPQRLNPAPAK